MQLSKVIFWDTDYTRIDWDQKARYVIGRVLMYGTLEDWQTIKAYYGKDRIKTEMMEERDLDDKTLSFLCCIYDLPKESFRCYTERPSRLKHWTY